MIQELSLSGVVSAEAALNDRRRKGVHDAQDSSVDVRHHLHMGHDRCNELHTYPSVLIVRIVWVSWGAGGEGQGQC